jgi:hypothetical protein
MTGISFAMIVRILELFYTEQEFPFTLYVFPACLALLPASFASEGQVRFFVTSKLAQKMSARWTIFPKTHLCRPSAVHPQAQSSVARIQNLSAA